MKAKIIKRDGQEWSFPSVEEARQHVKEDRTEPDYIEEKEGEKTAVWDDRGAIIF